MTNLARSAVLFAPLVCVAGCGVVDPTLDVASEAPAVVTANGQMQNGQMQNGQMQNGQMQNGQMQNGAAMQLTGVDLGQMSRLIHAPAAGADPDVSSANRVKLVGVHLEQSKLVGDGLAGTDFRGYVVYGSLVSDTQVTQNVWLYIESITPPTADAPDIWHYVLKAYHRFVPATGQSCNGTCQMQWDYVCGAFTQKVIDPDTGGITTRLAGYPATAVGGQWDYRVAQPGGGRKLIEQSDSRYDTFITFACSSGAIGKCVEKAHYRPWASAALECKSGIPIRCTHPTQELLHEACVRMVRADYCGDGQTHTINGISVDVWDQSHVDTETPYGPTETTTTVPYGHEAEWTANGARCLAHMLMTRTSHLGTDMTVGDYLASHYWCENKWPTPWDDGSCFGGSSTYFYNNVPSTMDAHDRVLIRNKSVCIDDGGSEPNAMRTTLPWCKKCLPDHGAIDACLGNAPNAPN